jgi:hypothetical protein
MSSHRPCLANHTYLRSASWSPQRFAATQYLPDGWPVEQSTRAGLSLEREFLADPGFTVRGAPGPVESRSYLFSRSS